MDMLDLLKSFGFTSYESLAYLSLLTQHPVNGSQLSRVSGVARSRVYDVLRGLLKRGLVFEVEQGKYVPLPFEELKKQLRSQCEANLNSLEEQLSSRFQDTAYEFIYTLQGYDNVIARAREIINKAQKELYLRMFPNTWERLRPAIQNALNRGVSIRLICMGEMPQVCDMQVTHPDIADLGRKLGGESLDVVADKKETLMGIFLSNEADSSPFIWSRNRWFVVANRDSLRHDFYHYFLNKIVEQGEEMSARDKKIYEFIKIDD